MSTERRSETAPSFEIRPLVTEQEFVACLELQRATWGDDFRELVPAALLQITQKVGGVAAGAFDSHDTLIGFVYGISGIRDGVPSHWSHMLAVRQELRGRGVGQALKRYQREVLRALGVEQVFWTFDPLVARNGHLNLMRLGATVTEYVPNMYGDTSMNQTDSVIGTDRFIVRWDLMADAEATMPLVSTRQQEQAPIVTAHADAPDQEPTRAPPLPAAPLVRVEVPQDVQELKQRAPAAAAAWRATTRRAFQHYLESDYTVRGFVRDRLEHRCYYLLARR